MTPCSVDACSTGRYGRQPWCVKHYTRVKRYGDPSVSKINRSPDLLSRLADKSATDGECHVWTGHRTFEGYGKVRWQARVYLSHRLMFEAHHGPIAAGLVVCHTCDNPPCLRLDHLFLGTDAENSHDRDRKGRQVALRGSRHGNSVLTEQQVREIRAAAAQGVPHTVIAANYQIVPSNVWSIVRRLTWKHIE